MTIIKTPLCKCGDFVASELRRNGTRVFHLKCEQCKIRNRGGFNITEPRTRYRRVTSYQIVRHAGMPITIKEVETKNGQ